MNGVFFIQHYRFGYLKYKIILFAYLFSAKVLLSNFDHYPGTKDRTPNSSRYIQK